MCTSLLTEIVQITHFCWNQIKPPYLLRHISNAISNHFSENVSDICSCYVIRHQIINNKGVEQIPMFKAFYINQSYFVICLWFDLFRAIYLVIEHQKIYNYK